MWKKMVLKPVIILITLNSIWTFHLFEGWSIPRKMYRCIHASWYLTECSQCYCLISYSSRERCKYSYTCGEQTKKHLKDQISFATGAMYISLWIPCIEQKILQNYFRDTFQNSLSCLWHGPQYSCIGVSVTIAWCCRCNSGEESSTIPWWSQHVW